MSGTLHYTINQRDYFCFSNKKEFSEVSLFVPGDLLSEQYEQIKLRDMFHGGINRRMDGNLGVFHNKRVPMFRTEKRRQNKHVQCNQINSRRTQMLMSTLQTL